MHKLNKTYSWTKINFVPGPSYHKQIDCAPSFGPRSYVVNVTAMHRGGAMRAELAQAQRFLTKQMEIHGWILEWSSTLSCSCLRSGLFSEQSKFKLIDNSIYKTYFFHHCSLASVAFRSRIVAHNPPHLMSIMLINRCGVCYADRHGAFWGTTFYLFHRGFQSILACRRRYTAVSTKVAPHNRKKIVPQNTTMPISIMSIMGRK